MHIIKCSSHTKYLCIISYVEINPRVDGGRLHKEAPEEKVSAGSSTILTAVKLQRSLPRAPCTVYGRLGPL
jgi:hypothetical protein